MKSHELQYGVYDNGYTVYISEYTAFMTPVYYLVTVKEGYEPFNKRELDAQFVIRSFYPEVEWLDSENLLIKYGDPYGDSVKMQMERIFNISIIYEPEEYIRHSSGIMLPKNKNQL